MNVSWRFGGKGWVPNEWMNEWVRKVFVEKPRLHRVCKFLRCWKNSAVGKSQMLEERSCWKSSDVERTKLLKNSVVESTHLMNKLREGFQTKIVFLLDMVQKGGRGFTPNLKVVRYFCFNLIFIYNSVLWGWKYFQIFRRSSVKALHTQKLPHRCPKQGLRTWPLLQSQPRSKRRQKSRRRHKSRRR